MPRSIWNGTISFGLINVPVKLYTATESKTVRFREVHLEDGARIEHRRFCSKEDKEVPYEEVVKGYEVAEGEYVVLDKEEIEAAAGDRAQVDRGRGVRRRPPTSTRSSSTRPTTSARATKARTPTGCCTTRWSRPAAPASGASRSTTASTSRRSGRSTACSRCTRCASPTSSWPATTSTSRRRAAAPAKREVEMAAQLVESLHEDVRPRALQGRVPRGGARADRAQGGGQGDRAAAEEEPEEDAADLMAALEASLDGGALMARSLWTGSLSFGLVNVPVRSSARCATSTCTSASCTRRTARRSRRAASARRRTRRSPSRRSATATSSTTADQVVLTDEELATVAPRKTRTIDIEAFVDLADVDPIYFDHPYFLAAGRRGARGRARLPAAARGHGSARTAPRSAASCMRTKEYLVVVRVRDDRLALTTMLFHDEVRPAKGIPTGRQEAEEGRSSTSADRADRGAGRRLGPGALRGPLPRAPARRHRAQEQGQADHRRPSEERSPRRCPT